MVDINFIAVAGTVVAKPKLRRRVSGVTKTEFVLEVKRPFIRASGEVISDLFLCYAYGPLAEQCYDCLSQDTQICVTGRLQKEVIMRRTGHREHFTFLFVKWFKIMNQSEILQGIGLEGLRRDSWSNEVILELYATMRKIIET